MRQVHGAIRAEKDPFCLQHCPLGSGGEGVEAGLCAAEAVDYPVAGDGDVLQPAMA